MEKLKLAVIDTGGCAGCELELASTLSNWDIPIELIPDERIEEANILVFTGSLTNKFMKEFQEIKNKIKPGMVIVAMGVCPLTGNVFRETSNAPLNKHLPVDVSIPGCPPKPNLIKSSLEKATEIWRQRNA